MVVVRLSDNTKSIRRVCSNRHCKKIFFCDNECNASNKLSNETQCWCPDCAKANKSWLSDWEKCETRFGD